MPTGRVAICATSPGSEEHRIIHAVPAVPGSSGQVIKFDADAFRDASESHEPVLVTGDELTDLISGDMAPLGWFEIGRAHV